MSRKTLHLHIGAHKTGTTLIQQTLTNHERWLNESGFSYPSCCWYSFAQHRLAFALKGLPDPARGDVPTLEAEAAELHEHLESCETPNVILSSEELFSAPPDGVARLLEHIGAHDIRIVAFVRRPDSLFESTYNEKIKNPGHPLRDPVEQHLAHPETVARDLDMPTHIDCWSRAAGHDKIRLACYEDGHPMKTFLRLLGLPDEDLEIPETRVNASISCTALEIMRYAKTLDLDLRTLARIEKAASHRFPRTRESLLSAAQKKTLLERYEPSLSEMFSGFGRNNPYRWKEVAPTFLPPHVRLPEEELSWLVSDLQGSETEAS